MTSPSRDERRPPHALSAVEAAVAIRGGALSATALVESCLGRIDALDGRVKAWVHVDRDGALARAAALDADGRAGLWRGPLHGVPVGLKDIFHAAGLRTTAGARGFADSRPAEDAESVARLRAAGAVILGKVHTTEFAYADPAVTRNPWHADRTPGGSSAGSAAAVAARMVPLALGTQTVGSVLRPAAFCGVVGLKPTRERISRRGVLPLAWSLDHVGILARTVADAALALGVLAGPGAIDGGSPGERRSVAAGVPGDVIEGRPGPPPRLGLVGSPLAELATPEMRRQLDVVARDLADRGAVVTPVELPVSVLALLSAVQVVLRAEAAAAHADRFVEHPEAYRPRIRTAIELGSLVPAPLYLRAQQLRRAVGRQMAGLLARHDALLMPPAPGPAPDPSTTGDATLNALASGLGLPAIALPTGLASDGLPLGVQLVSARGADARLLRAASWVEAAVGFHAEPPA